MPHLALVRHGESEWNYRGLWTGLQDVSLTPKGEKEAKKTGKALAHITFHCCHCSLLKRAKQTLQEIKSEIPQQKLQINFHPALDERDYGDFTGKNKWHIQKKYGEEQFLKWRRNWNEPIPNGETLRDVYNRVVPYYKNHILADIATNRNIIVSSCGNTLRALVKHIEKIHHKDIQKLEIANGEIRLYSLTTQGQIINKKVISLQQAQINQQ